MADANGAPRRVSMAYILGFSDKPYKEIKPPAPPPLPQQPRKPSQPTTITTTPGCIMEWTASDGRKGRLTGTGKPRLTAASLAKVPSEKRSTKEALGVKSTSKKTASTKPGVDGDDLWNNNTNAKGEPKESDSKKGDKRNLGELGSGNNDPSVDLWQNPTGASCGDDKRDEKKADTAANRGTTASAPAVPEAGENPAPDVEDEKMDNDSNAWTKEQDEKLMQMKTKDLKSRAQIGEEIGGKTRQECIDRFKQIKPDGWRSNDVNQSRSNREGKGRNEQKKGKNQNYNQNQNKGEKSKDEKKDGNKEKGKRDTASGGVEAWDMPGGGDGGLFPDTFGGDTGDSKDDSSNKETSRDNVGGDTIGADTSAWDYGNTTGGGDGPNGAAVKWNTDSNNDQNKNRGGASIAGPWTSTAPAQNTSPEQAPSQSRSQHKASNNNNTTTHRITARPLELEVKPDDTFSADDLRLVARILQQDCSMVWNRVSWRFRDKTGRTLHPDDFEKKITGNLEGNESEKSERRR